MSDETLGKALESYDLMQKLSSTLETDKFDAMYDFIGDCISTELNISNEEGFVFRTLDYLVGLPFGYEGTTVNDFLKAYEIFESGSIPF